MKYTGLKTQKIRAFATLIVWIALGWSGLAAPQISAETRALMDPFFNQRLRPANRIEAGFLSQELSSRHDYYLKYQTLYAAGEYTILPNWSIYGELPYSFRDETRSDKTRHLDNLHLGTRAGYKTGNWMPVLGFDIEWATGDPEKTAIGSKELGRLELLLGIDGQLDQLLVAGALRANGQTNKQFREGQNQQFERTYWFELTMGWRLDPVDLLLEYNYKYRNDPEYSAVSQHTLAPGLRWNINSTLHIGLSVPCAISREREWGYAPEIRLSAFY